MEYYRRGKIECWDFIRDQDLNFHLGNSIKYICRAGHKGGQLKRCEDLEKAIHYLQNELEHEENLYQRTSEGISNEVRSEERPFTYDEIVSEGSYS